MSSLKVIRSSLAFVLGAGLLLLSACGKKEAASTAAKHDARDEAKAFYATHADFFHFKTPADIPTGLNWQDGHELTEFASPEAKRGGTINFWLQDFPRTLRTVGPDSNGSFRPWILDDNTMLYARRHPNQTDLTPDGFHYFPGIADRWALDRANKTVYIHINPAARWSDGAPLTTEDVLFSHFFYRSAYIKAPWYNNYYSTKFASLTRFDDHTFALQFPELRPDILAQALENEPTPAHFYAELGDDYPERYQWRSVPTSGAYTVRDQDIDKGRAITLTHVKDWWAQDLKFWRHRNNPDRIRLTVIRDNAKAFEAFRKGDLDFFNLRLSEDWYDKLPDSAPEVRDGYIHKLKFFNDIPRPTYGLWMNETKPLLANQDIRAGIQYAMNWELVIQKFARGDWVRMQTTSDGYGEFTHPTLRARTFSVEQALAHFAKGGFTKRGPDGILVNDAGQRLSVQVTTGYEHYKDVLTILQEEALKAGLDLRVEVLDNTASWKKVQEKKHEIVFSAFNVGPEMFPRYWETYHSANAYDQAFLPDGSVNPARKIKTQTNNLQEFATPEFDRMIEAYDKSESLAEMKQLAFKMEELLYDDASFSPGFIIPFMRTGTWRWVGVPKEGNVKIVTQFEEYRLFWVDEEMKRATETARKTGQTFPPGVKVYDQYKQP
ncbi:MAG: ABC transporter substrate-binding protein [Opitutaceae bacterium]|nr:ABC transporter substrate-binding protein [Opitutaceae bacterium]MBP9912557.1 ABC transporter substrate-binding protein [Opitutaceae bacterium]